MRAAVIAAVVLVSPLVAACGGDTEAVTTTVTAPAPTATSKTETTADDSTTKTSEPGTVGQAFTIGGTADGEPFAQEVRLLAVKRFKMTRAICDPETIGDCPKNRRGRAFVAARVKVKAITGPLDECGGNSLSVMTEDGDEGEVVHAYGLKPEFSCEKRREGQSVKGWVTFDMPASARDVIVSWRPYNGNAPDDMQWKVTL